jgi:apolipoprotein N-acyltransferase
MLRYFAASALMLTVIQAPFDAGPLAWVCLVPFILVCRPDANPRRLALAAYVVSFVYWLGNLYWIGYVTIPAYVLLSLSQGLYWPVLACCVRYVRKRWPGGLLVTVPVLFAGAEAWQGVIYTGFDWRLLGHSQWNVLPVIQISDIFGALGVSVLVAMVNGLIAGLIIDSREGRLTRRVYIVRVAVAGGLMLATLLYGRFRLNETEDCISKGPLLGSVQSNIPSDIKELSESGDMILEKMFELSNQCLAAGAELVAWPETIVLSSLNPDYVSLCRPETTPVIYDKALCAHARGRGYILLGAHTAKVISLDEGIGDQYNSAFLYRPDGKQDPKRYDKIHLVPFGEYIPFKDTLPFVYHLILKLSPYDYDYNLTKGTEYTIFDMQTGRGKYGFGVLICYEDTDAKVTRKMVVGEDGGEKADWLVNLSNDGWYVRYKDSKVYPSVELSQRTAITVFRAIENRTSIIRSVNTGISCMIDSTGKVRNGYTQGTLPQKTMARQGVEGWFVDTIDIDGRVTFFSRHGQWLDGLCGAAITILILIMVFERIKTRFNRESVDQ